MCGVFEEITDLWHEADPLAAKSTDYLVSKTMGHNDRIAGDLGLDKLQRMAKYYEDNPRAAESKAAPIVLAALATAFSGGSASPALAAELEAAQAADTAAGLMTAQDLAVINSGTGLAGSAGAAGVGSTAADLSAADAGAGLIPAGEAGASTMAGGGTGTTAGGGIAGSDGAFTGEFNNAPSDLDFAGARGVNTGGSPNYLGMGANLLGTAAGLYSTNKAVDAQREAAENATNLQRGIYNDTVARNEPFVKGGTNALATLLEQLGIGGGSGNLLKTVDPQSVQSDPGYQWAQQQGQQAIERQLAARGLTGSGRSLKAASRFNTGNATQFFTDAFNRNQGANLQKFNMLSAPVGWGQASANQTAAAGQQFGTSAGNNMIGAGDASAAGTIAQSNLLRDALNQGVSQYQNRPRYDQYGNLIQGG